MKLLVLGGTQFIGRHVVEALVARGEDVTLVHRGQTNPDLFPEREHRLADRNKSLAVLGSGRWDATIDVSAYFPRQVRLLHESLGDRGGAYVHISSVSAYAFSEPGPTSEDAPLALLDDPSVEVVTNTTYGPLKAACEREAHARFGTGSEVPVAIIRPTYVVGPYDHTYRFSWWIERLARGGRILAPAPPSSSFQVVDVRDLAEFIVSCALRKTTGAFNVSGPDPDYTFGQFLSLGLEVVAPPMASLSWIPGEKLVAEALGPKQLPLWSGADLDEAQYRYDSSRALAAGLRLRPLRETMEDVASFVARWPVSESAGIGLAPEREADLLARLAD